MRLQEAVDAPVWPWLTLCIAVQRISVRGRFSPVLHVNVLRTQEPLSTADVRIWFSAVSAWVGWGGVGGVGRG